MTGADCEEKRARDFMRVLAQNDSRFAQALRAHRGAPYVSVRPSSADESAGDEALAHAVDVLYTAVYDAMGTALLGAWDARYDEAVAYHAEHGRLPPSRTPGGLGRWVDTQRGSRATMAPERKARLEALAWWVWWACVARAR